ATANAPNSTHTMKLTVRCNQAPTRVGQCPLRRAEPRVLTVIDGLIPRRPAFTQSDWFYGISYALYEAQFQRRKGCAGKPAHHVVARRLTCGIVTTCYPRFRLA